MALFGPNATLSAVRWRWVLLGGAAVAALAFALMYLAVNTYVAILSVLSLGEPNPARIEWFGGFMAVLGLPALYFLLTVGAAARLVRRVGTATVWQGVLIGLVSAASLQIIGLAFGPPLLRELIVYPLLGVAGGWWGSTLGRTVSEGQERLYRASADIGAAADPQDVAGAIGEHLSGTDVEQVTLWNIAPRTENDGPLEFELLGSWAPRAEGPWPDGGRLDSKRMPALAGMRRRSPRVVRREELPPSEREAWERLGIRSALLVPLSASGDGPDGLLVVASRKGQGFPRGKVRTYQTVSSQAALALENLRLLGQARRSGVLGERNRLAREIHDTLIQGFASIVMNLEAAEGSLERDPAPTRRHLDEARRTAREGLAEARRIVWALRPEALEGAPLSEALTRLAERWSEGSGVPAGVTVTGTPRPLSPEIEVTLLRAAQEALTNVRKHARASRVMLTLSYMGERVALDVQDDGVGFELDGTRAISDGTAGGYGLRAMRERVEQSGGTLLVESKPGGGTTLAVELPVAADGRAGQGKEVPQ